MPLPLLTQGVPMPAQSRLVPSPIAGPPPEVPTAPTPAGRAWGLLPIFRPARHHVLPTRHPDPHRGPTPLLLPLRAVRPILRTAVAALPQPIPPQGVATRVPIPAEQVAARHRAATHLRPAGASPVARQPVPDVALEASAEVRVPVAALAVAADVLVSV